MHPTLSVVVTQAAFVASLILLHSHIFFINTNMSSSNIGEGSRLPMVGAELVSICTEDGHIGGNCKGEEDDLNTQLWLACAGPMVNVPRAGDKVYYFPQGHIEQLEAFMNQNGNAEMPVYNVPPKFLCKVVCIHFKAEANTDEVIAQITLLPEDKEPSVEEGTSLPPPQKNGVRSFSKRLTPSDISTHGGFSLPKRYVDKCFPPLDMSQEPPARELVAKDMHGSEWRFRHIYRGQPRRHLLTTGWSVFLGAKKLVTGDACIFLRGENGELYVGVRRATRPQNTVSAFVLSSASMQHGILATAFHAITTRSMFTVYYRPWTGPTEFIIPYDQYMKSAEIDYSIGTRFRMQFESEGCPEQKCQKFTGTVVADEDIDCIRWPDSEWKRIKVRWEATSYAHYLPERVSSWSIEPTGIIKKKRKSVPLPPKRARPFDTSTPMFPFVVKDGMLRSSIGSKYQRYSGVLQGQEIIAVGASANFSSQTYASERRDETEAPLDQQDSSGKYMLFGVDLINSPSGLPSPQVGSSSYLCYGHRACTKVFKYGTALGRSVDLKRFHGYKELISELDHMFEFKGMLIDESSGWLVTYTDGEGEMLLLGDCPWGEFRAMVQKMFICPKVNV